jgi:hypothetical protein
MCVTQEFFEHTATEQPEFFEAADSAALASKWWHDAILPVSLALSSTLFWAQWRRRRKAGAKWP